MGLEFLRKEKLNPIGTRNGVPVDINEIENASLSLDEYRALRGNSPFWEVAIQKVDNTGLDWICDHYLKNSRCETQGTYDFAIKTYLIPELLKRLKELDGR